MNQTKDPQEFRRYFISTTKIKTGLSYYPHYIAFDEALEEGFIPVVNANLYETLQSKLAEAEAENKKLRDALEYYANENNWYGIDKDRTDTIMYSDLEQLYGDTLHGGKRAREALKSGNKNG